ncbi:Hypothetical protein A7982_04821 [Minicystis rosea]|nr:Hypothetical protein A7982_04821 [Minicystis rosea]
MLRPPDVRTNGYHVYAHDGGVLVLPAMRGVELTAAWWAPDGVSFVEAPLDFGSIEIGPKPVIDVLNNRIQAASATANGIGFFRIEGHFVEATIGPRVTYRRSVYRSPAEFKFRLEALTIDERGTWWASGHLPNDDLIGLVYQSSDGMTWQPVSAKFEGSVIRLYRDGETLVAVHNKQVSTISPAGVTKLCSMKDHLHGAVVTPAVTLGLGRGFIGVLPAGAKRAKYTTPPAGYADFDVIAFEDGFLMGGDKGLFSSSDGLTWQPVPSFTGSVSAMVPSASGVIVVSTGCEVYVVRAA